MFNDGGWFLANAKLAAAMELARIPEARGNSTLQDEVCRSFGIPFSSMTNDEIAEFQRLIHSYAKGSM